MVSNFSEPIDVTRMERASAGPGRWIAALGAAVVLALPVRLAAEEVVAAPAVPIEYSILTPALEGKYFVYSYDQWYLPLLPGFANTARTKALRKLVDQERYKATDHFALQLKDALQSAGYAADIEFVPRAPDGTAHGLSRADLPEHPQGRYLIDVTMQSVGLGAMSNFTHWEPYVLLTWRLVASSGHIIGLPHKYEHRPDHSKDNEKNQRTRDCELPSFFSLMDDPAPLWACFDRGFHDASVNLIPAIREATPGS